MHVCILMCATCSMQQTIFSIKLCGPTGNSSVHIWIDSLFVSLSLSLKMLMIVTSKCDPNRSAAPSLARLCFDTALIPLKMMLAVQMTPRPENLDRCRLCLVCGVRNVLAGAALAGMTHQNRLSCIKRDLFLVKRGLFSYQLSTLWSTETN